MIDYAYELQVSIVAVKAGEDISEAAIDQVLGAMYKECEKLGLMVAGSLQKKVSKEEGE